MKHFYLLISITLVFFLMIIGFHHFSPELFKDVKITDYISSVSSMLSLVIAIYAFYYAKDFLGQERKRNASNFAIEILHKDVMSLSKTQDVFYILYGIEQAIRQFYKATTNEEERRVIANLKACNEKLPKLLENMSDKVGLMREDIFKASIVGCKIRSDVTIFDDVMRDYNYLTIKMMQLQEDLSYVLAPKIDDVLGEFINQGEVEKKLPKLDETITSVTFYFKKVQSKIQEVQGMKLDLNDVFIFN
ncbi:hypothetical protein [Pantoea sp. JK]|uniref:hypothetical protein n=1 Tax=Pantoea sp. JK TaxID=2871703 RepID=UPI002238223D|nr:hypothetical protein [Pantoea sp. JK]MCW6030152.1 hypothetical protein [Pantoea sp. JK]